MYLTQRKTGEEARVAASQNAPFGPGFTPEVVKQIETLEIHGSSFTDAGEDFCEFRAINADGIQFAAKRLAGY